MDIGFHLGRVRVEVDGQRIGTSSNFEGYDGETDSDATADHDEWLK